MWPGAYRHWQELAEWYKEKRRIENPTMMSLTPLQVDLLRSLRAAVGSSPTRRIIYRTEWLGYLPYGLYHWIEVDGQDISIALPLDFQRADVNVLENVKCLVKIEEWRNPDDEFESITTYAVIPG